jgi:hypothetical protein
MSLNLQTNKNLSRYFFATTENGEQTLGLQYGTTGGTPNLSTMAVTISGAVGNGVIVNTAPSYQATDYIFSEGGIGAYGSTYFTPSTLATTVTGINLTSDRKNGSGTACIEAYAGNGSVGGLEFLSRGVSGAVVSSINVNMNNYLSSIGTPGATGLLQGNGTLFTANADVAPYFTSLNEQAGGGGRPCFGIQDLSGALGITPQARWAIGTTGVATGGNTGSDYALFAYSDAGAFISAPYSVRRADGAMSIQNISSISATLGGTARGQVFPIVADNTEFGADTNVVVIAGATSNQALFGSVWAPLFSTPVANLNPNLESLVNINWANTLSTGSNHVNFKIGFSTATAYTNIVQTSYVPGLGGSFSPSGQPGATSPIGHTNICAVLDPDGLDATGAGFLYVEGQFSDPSAPADNIFVAKGTTSEPTRNALTYKTI